MGDGREMHATIPRIGLAKLGRLRGYERLFHVAWGIVRWATLAAVLVAIATYIDWRVDKDRETPFALRAACCCLSSLRYGSKVEYCRTRPALDFGKSSYV